MSLTTTFTSKVRLAADGPAAHFWVWTYTVQPSSPADLASMQRIALAIPADIDAQDPGRYPEVDALDDAFLEHDTNLSRQYVGKTLPRPATGAQTISFVAPAGQTDREVLLVGAATGRPWTVLPYAKTPGGTVSSVQVLPAPASGQRVTNGRPVSEFAGTLPYASEVFGVYQPLLGWRGQQSEQRFTTSGRIAPEALRALADQQPPIDAVLSPIGLVNLFREYFFEFDTFLGTPTGHLWLSPGGTVEVIETSTRRTLTEQTAEQSETVTRKVEESLTEQSDVADAVKESNANDTTLGASASGGGKFAGIWHAEGSASFSTHNTTNRSSEQTHKFTRTQSSKVTSEITRNFKTTFKAVTETTDTNSRRYVVQNTTDELVNYELRRKMRKVGVQLQHLGTQLSWQLFLGPTEGPGGTVVGSAPGLQLGLGELVDVVPAPDMTSVKKPEYAPIPGPLERTYQLTVPFQQLHGGGPDNELTYETSNENQDHGIFRPDVGENNIIQFWFEYPLPLPPTGYQLSKIGAVDFHGADVAFVLDNPDHGHPNPDVGRNTFALRLTHANFREAMALPFSATLVYEPLPATVKAVEQANADAKAEYETAVALILRQAYASAVADRVKLVSGVRPRPSDDLRKEERQAVFGLVVQMLDQVVPDAHLAAELIRQMFDVDQMLYFVAADYWRPKNVVSPATSKSAGRYEVPPAVWNPANAPAYMDKNDPLLGETVVSWYSHTSAENPPDATDDRDPVTPPANQEWRVNYLITGDTQPAPMGSSLGWLIQSDGDARRNEFLNAAWVKVVLPIRPGNEQLAFQWLQIAEVEGREAFDVDYTWHPGDPESWRGQKIGWVLGQLAEELQKSNTEMANTLATEKVFETGFDPLEGGFRPAEPYQVFSEWIEVLPTDQVVAVEVVYDPKTGQQR